MLGTIKITLRKAIFKRIFAVSSRYRILTGNSDVACESSKNVEPSGAFVNIISTENAIFMQDSSPSFNIEVPSINASRCSSIYGKSSGVQPAAYQILIIIKT